MSESDGLESGPTGNKLGAQEVGADSVWTTLGLAGDNAVVTQTARLPVESTVTDGNALTGGSLRIPQLRHDAPVLGPLDLRGALEQRTFQQNVLRGGSEIHQGIANGDSKSIDGSSQTPIQWS